MGKKYINFGLFGAFRIFPCTHTHTLTQSRFDPTNNEAKKADRLSEKELARH